MNSKELRQKFISFFESKGHKQVAAASLIPENDPSVLFTTAGMQQFKRFYLNPSEAPAARITTVQKCLRVIDIDEVGDDTHNTFFEMLGNFSFGYSEKKDSYFKKEAIEFAWDFLTNELAIDKSRIYATYFQSEKDIPTDEESLSLLKNIEGLKEIKPQGYDDNFWSLGTENSPGGPTVEFYVDGIEIWNLVFNEYIFQNGKYEKSLQQGIDTGLGFERVLVILNKVDNIYSTDLFELSYNKLREFSKNEDPKSERIILDHIRTAVFAINDDILPSNKDRGYIVRRLIRRAIVKANQIGIDHDFIADIAIEFFKTYDGVYEFRKDIITTELQKEEEKFRKTLSAGIKLLTNQKEISGKILFDLYQTYGLPLEISQEEAASNGLEVNSEAIEQFNDLLKQHQDLSRTASAGMFKGGLAGGGEMETKLHTATHLLLASLRQILSSDVMQKGANITAERLRFDFNYPDKLTPEQIEKIENLVNEKISEKIPVDMEEMSLEDAKNCGALGAFGEKYGFKVKVYTMGTFSKEICGGPHVKNTSELGHFKITKEESSSAGVRRIKAVLE